MLLVLMMIHHQGKGRIHSRRLKKDKKFLNEKYISFLTFSTTFVFLNLAVIIPSKKIKRKSSHSPCISLSITSLSSPSHFTRCFALADSPFSFTSRVLGRRSTRDVVSREGQPLRCDAILLRWDARAIVASFTWRTCCQ